MSPSSQPFVVGAGRSDAATELLLDHPHRRQERIQLGFGHFLLVCSSSPGSAPTGGIHPDGAMPSRASGKSTEIRRLEKSSCCPENSRLSITATSTGIILVNVGSSPWWRQPWETPRKRNDDRIRRSRPDSPDRSSWEQQASVPDLEPSRLVTIWLGATNECWRLGLINPAGIRPDDPSADRLTMPSERRFTPTTEQRQAVLAKYGAYLRFPASRAPRVWSANAFRADEACARPLAELWRRAVDHGFRAPARVADPDQLELLAFLLRTGSISYEQLADDARG